jgi:hypothetical protein
MESRYCWDTILCQYEGDALPNTEDAENQKRDIEQPRTPPMRRCIAYMVGKMHENAANKERETPADKAAARTAYATIWIAIFTIVLAVVTSLQLTEIRNEFRSSHRPWVDVVKMQPNGPLVFDADGAHVSVSFVLKNGGAAPASGVLIFGSKLMIRETMPVMAEDIRRVIDCEPTAANGLAAASDMAGFLLLPGEPREVLEDTVDTPTRQLFPAFSAQEVWLPLCIRYKDDMGHAHATGLLWSFISADGHEKIRPSGSVSGKFIQAPIGRSY